MSSKTQRWKNAERQVAEILKKYNIPAKRITRAGNYSESTYDVEIEGHPELKNDSKYSASGFKTNRLLDVVRDKYCKEIKDEPVLWTKGYRETSMKMTVDGEFGALLLAYWLGKDTKENLEKIRY